MRLYGRLLLTTNGQQYLFGDVAPEAEVQVGGKVQAYGSLVHAGQSNLTAQIEMERMTLCLGQLSAHVQTVVVVGHQVVGCGSSHDIGHAEATVLIR